MFNLVLYRPEIAPNTGACMRLAANVGCRLHLIEPLGFTLDDQKLRRAGMDYRDRAVVVTHQDLAAWIKYARPRRVFAFSNKGETRYSDVDYEIGDSLLLGPESVGLPDEVLSAKFVTEVVSIPMQPGVRSLNLANAAAIAVYEAWRQQSFALTDCAPG
ncbi:MAG: tRNA (cytidine(34)-2'-O)-methyltransferase [Acidimicrobiia bacterium]